MNPNAVFFLFIVSLIIIDYFIVSYYYYIFLFSVRTWLVNLFIIYLFSLFVRVCGCVVRKMKNAERYADKLAKKCDWEKDEKAKQLYYVERVYGQTEHSKKYRMSAIT